MKRPLLIGALGLVALCANAQKTLEDAPNIQMGDTEYARGESTYGTLYFKYTADSDQLLTITKNIQGSFLPTEDGTSNTTIAYVSANNGSELVIPVKKGQTIYLVIMTSDEEVKFTASAKAANVDGSSIVTAIEATKNDFFVPMNREKNSYGSYDHKPTYIKYTATDNDFLKMTFGGYVMNATIQEGETGTPTSFNVNSEYINNNIYYIGKAPVEKGKTYYISVQSYNPIYASFEEVVIKQGSSYDVAIPATEGANALAKETGKYWYSYTPSQNGFVYIKSDEDLAGGTVKVYNQTYQITYEQPISSVSGKMDLRFEATAGTTYYICVERANAASADGSFNLTLEAAKAGDTFNNPIALNANEGTETVPEANGTYYYSIVVPAGQHFITVNAPKGIAADASRTQTQVYLYEQSSQGNYSKASGRNGFREFVETYGETTYIIAWKCDEGSNAFAFNYSVTDVKDGDIARRPIAAVEGENDLASTNDTYYSFTPTQNGWLTIDTEPYINVEFMSPYGSIFSSVKSAGTNKMKAEANQTYIIKVSGAKEGDYFDLSMVDFVKGESINNPIDVTAQADEPSSVELPQKALDYWYRYTAPKDGKLTVSSDMTAGLGENALYVKVGLNGELRNFKDSKMEGNVSVNAFEGSVFVNKGDEVYVNVVLKDAQQGKKVTFAMADPQAGETVATAINISSLSELTLPLASRITPIWYCIDVAEPGVIEMNTVDYDPNDGQTHNNYFGADVYATNDDGSVAGSSITSSMSYYDSAKGIQTCGLKLIVNGKDVKPGHYLIQVNSTYGETPVTITTRDIKQGEDASTPIELEPGEYTFGAASNGNPAWYSVNLDKGELNIVTTDASKSYWYAQLFATDETGMPMGYGLTNSNISYDQSGSYSQLTYTIDGEVAKPGLYLIKVTGSNEGTTAQISFTTHTTDGIQQVADSHAAISSLNGSIQAVNGNNIDVFDLTGRVVAKGQQNVKVNKGVYVVRTSNGKTIKVSVK